MRVEVVVHKLFGFSCSTEVFILSEHLVSKCQASLVSRRSKLSTVIRLWCRHALMELTPLNPSLALVNQLDGFQTNKKGCNEKQDG